MWPPGHCYSHAMEDKPHEWVASPTTAFSSPSKGECRTHQKKMRNKDPNSTANLNRNSFSYLMHVDIPSTSFPRQTNERIEQYSTAPISLGCLYTTSDYSRLLLPGSWAGVSLCLFLSPELSLWALTSVININYCKDSCLVLLVRTSAWRVIDGFRLASCQEGSIVFICDT